VVYSKILRIFMEAGCGDFEKQEIEILTRKREIKIKAKPIHLPCFCIVHAYVVIHFCDSMWKRTCAVFFYRLLIMYCRGRSSYQEVVRIPLTSLILPHFWVGPKPRPGFPTSYVMVLLSSVSSVDMGGDC